MNDDHEYTGPHLKPWCGRLHPREGHPCRLTSGHTGDHVFYWARLDPGRIRATWPQRNP